MMSQLGMGKVKSSWRIPSTPGRGMKSTCPVAAQAPRSLPALAAGHGVGRAARPDIRPVEQVVLDPNDGVVGLVCPPPGLRVEHTDPPWPKPPVEPAPCEDRHRRTTRVEADA